MKRLITSTTLGAILITCGFVGSASAQTVVKPGFNVFSVSQDVEIGQQSAAQVERQMPVVNDAATNRYIASLGARLAAQAPGPKFDYHFKVVDVSDVNAFALPGGYIYVHRGLLEQVHDEGELAGVMSHEIAHVALRHPTNQVTKAYMAQAGLGLLGGLLGGGSSGTGQIINAVGGFGLNTLFLKFSRSAESQADVVGSQIMARAGYDPVDMARFFNYLAQQNSSRTATFLSDHPAPADREARVRQEARMLQVRPLAAVGNLGSIQGRLRRMAPAPSMAQLAVRQQAAPQSSRSSQSSNQPYGSSQSSNYPQDSYPQNNGPAIERPSSQYRAYMQPDGLYQIDAPSNWTVYASNGGYGVTIVPRGTIDDRYDNGQQHVTYGVIVNHYVPFNGSVGSRFVEPDDSRFGNTQLEQATSDLIDNIEQSNPHLRYVAGTERRTTLSGQQAMMLTLRGRNPDTGDDEQVMLVTRALPDEHIIYMLMIAPRDDYSDLSPTFDRMMRSLRTDNRSIHG